MNRFIVYWCWSMKDFHKWIIKLMRNFLNIHIHYFRSSSLIVAYYSVSYVKFVHLFISRWNRNIVHTMILPTFRKQRKKTKKLKIWFNESGLLGNVRIRLWNDTLNCWTHGVNFIGKLLIAMVTTWHKRQGEWNALILIIHFRNSRKVNWYKCGKNNCNVSHFACTLCI